MLKIANKMSTETHAVHISLLLQIVSREKGCKGYSPKINIPDNIKLTGSLNTSTQMSFFTTFHAQY